MPSYCSDYLKLSPLNHVVRHVWARAQKVPVARAVFIVGQFPALENALAAASSALDSARECVYADLETVLIQRLSS